MKKTLLIISTAFIILSACTSIKHIPGYEKLTGLDFRPFADKGFLITPYVFNGDYISIYMVNYVIMPEANYMPANPDNVGTGDYTSGSWTFKKLNIETALNNIYETCVEMGADALMDFQLQSNKEYYTGINNPVTVNGIQITGIAIKRQE